ncbi:MAG: transcriptional repressor [Planctomycetota bacterium]|nr:MAG: transcriptional repressor [Planctomycetota bacterium]
MKTAPPEPSTCIARGEQLRQALESAGWRFTRQRAAVFDYLSSVESHPTAEEVYDAVRRRLPRISLATVYKALEALVECRLADKLTANEGPARYDCHSEAHYHLRCLKTGEVRDLPTRFDPQLLEKLQPGLLEEMRRQGFQVTGYRLEVVGEFEKR